MSVSSGSRGKDVQEVVSLVLFPCVSSWERERSASLSISWSSQASSVLFNEIIFGHRNILELKRGAEQTVQFLASRGKKNESWWGRSSDTRKVKKEIREGSGDIKGYDKERQTRTGHPLIVWTEKEEVGQDDWKGSYCIAYQYCISIILFAYTILLLVILHVIET